MILSDFSQNLVVITETQNIGNMGDFNWSVKSHSPIHHCVYSLGHRFFKVNFNHCQHPAYPCTFFLSLSCKYPLLFRTPHRLFTGLICPNIHYHPTTKPVNLEMKDCKVPCAQSLKSQVLLNGAGHAGFCPSKETWT